MFMFPDEFVRSRGDGVYSTLSAAVPAPIFRKSFVVKDIPASAELVVGASGFYDLFLNGIKITKGHLAPYITNPDEVVFYDRYELSDMLCRGENVIAVMLGNGNRNPVGGRVWHHDISHDRSAPSFALSFRCDDAGVCFSSPDMKWADSHILFDDMRVGTYCDMTRYDKGIFLAGYDESVLSQPIPAKSPSGKKLFAECEPVRALREISPVSFRAGELRDYRLRTCFSDVYQNESGTVMTKTPVTGGYIYDFGENVAGNVRLRIKGYRGQVIHMQFCELMTEGFADCVSADVYPDGCAQKDVYVVGSDEEEIYVPPFTYHGFRYCYVHGITKEQATSSLLTCLVMHSDVEKRGAFSCSDQISNKIVDACRRSDLSNLYYIITDCPAREKNGWTGDAAVSAEHFMQFFGAENCFADWLSCIRTTQSPDGAIPLIVPSFEGRSDSPIWDSVLFYLPYAAYRYAGRLDIVKDNADAMMKNFRSHLLRRDGRGIVESGYGDWLPVDKAAAEYASPLGFCCTAVLCDECRVGSIMMRAAGRHADAVFLENTRQELIEALRREYNDAGVIISGRTPEYVKPTYRVCQTSQVLGLYIGMFDENEKITAKNTLLRLIGENDEGFDCGFLGLRYIFRVLSELGESETAFRMITKPTHPSYANMIYRGETSVWERFSIPGSSVGSHNHHFMADVSGWYIRHIAGINVNPDSCDPDSVMIAPEFIKSLSFASASYKTPNGKVSVCWRRNEDKKCISVNVNIEGNMRAHYAQELFSDSVTLTENGIPKTRR